MKTYAILAEFAGPAELLEAARGIRNAGYRRFDCHSPFPIHGMDAAMGLRRSPVGLIVGGMCLLGAAAAFALQSWVSTSAYPLVISGKPLWSWQAFVVVTFAMFVLFGTAGAVFGMLRLNRLPRLHHPLFYSDRFRRASDNGFMVSIDAGDLEFDVDKTPAFLASLGALHTELVRGE